MIPIPAIDLLDGKAVRLQQGNYESSTIYYNNPIDAARKFAECGLPEIHVVDLNGAKDGTFRNLNFIQEIASKTELVIQSGGGVRSISDARRLLDAGVNRVVCSSMAAKKPEDFEQLIEMNHGAHAVLGLDLKDGKFAYGGWLKTNSESYHDFIERFRIKGLQFLLSTDIGRDGMLTGPNFDLYDELTHHYPDLHIIASGGISGITDLERLSSRSVYGAIIGKAFYEDKLSLKQLRSIYTKTN